MARFLAAIAFLAWSSAAQAATLRVIGLIDVRGIAQPSTTLAGKGVAQKERREGVKLYRDASNKAAVAEVVDSIEMIETEYRDKFTRAAKVYDSKNGWFLIGWKKGYAWISPENAGTFYPVEKLVGSGLTFLTPHWDGQLWKVSPMQGSPLKLVRSESLKNARVVESRQVADETWFLVEILSSHGCNAETPVKRYEGWVPLYAKTGQANLWFQARGCGAG